MIRLEVTIISIEGSGDVLFDHMLREKTNRMFCLRSTCLVLFAWARPLRELSETNLCSRGDNYHRSEAIVGNNLQRSAYEKTRREAVRQRKEARTQVFNPKHFISVPMFDLREWKEIAGKPTPAQMVGHTFQSVFLYYCSLCSYSIYMHCCKATKIRKTGSLLWAFSHVHKHFAPSLSDICYTGGCNENKLAQVWHQKKANKFLQEKIACKFLQTRQLLATLEDCSITWIILQRQTFLGQPRWVV